MGWTRRMCMVRGCTNDYYDKTWNDNTYSSENPFLCEKHREISWDEAMKLDRDSECRDTPQREVPCFKCGKKCFFFISTPTNQLKDEDLTCCDCEVPERKE